MGEEGDRCMAASEKMLKSQAMLSPLPGHFLVGAGNAKLLWLLGRGAGNIIICTVISEGIKEESPTGKFPKKTKALRVQNGHFTLQSRGHRKEQTTLGQDRGPFPAPKRSPHICSWCSVPNKIPTSAPFHVFMYRPSVFVCMNPSMWCMYELLLPGWDPRQHKYDEGFVSTFHYTI